MSGLDGEETEPVDMEAGETEEEADAQEAAHKAFLKEMGVTEEEPEVLQLIELLQRERELEENITKSMKSGLLSAAYRRLEELDQRKEVLDNWEEAVDKASKNASPSDSVPPPYWLIDDGPRYWRYETPSEFLVHNHLATETADLPAKVMLPLATPSSHPQEAVKPLEIKYEHYASAAPVRGHMWPFMQGLERSGVSWAEEVVGGRYDDYLHAADGVDAPILDTEEGRLRHSVAAGLRTLQHNATASLSQKREVTKVMQTLLVAGSGAKRPQQHAIQE